MVAVASEPAIVEEVRKLARPLADLFVGHAAVALHDRDAIAEGVGQRVVQESELERPVRIAHRISLARAVRFAVVVMSR